MNREYNVFERYFSDQDYMEFEYCGSRESIDHFLSMYDSGELIEGNAPDMVLVKENEAIIMEHFEFDSFPSNRKGSTRAQEEKRIDRVYDRQEATADGVYFSETIRNFNSYVDYVRNVKKNFLDHYSKIESYKTNLKNRGIIDDNTDLKVMFVIEDKSTLGTIVKDENKETQLVMLHHSPEFLQMFSECVNVDYILFFTSFRRKDYASFIDRGNLCAYFDEALDYKNMKFLAFRPHVIMFKKYV